MLWSPDSCSQLAFPADDCDRLAGAGEEPDEGRKEMKINAHLFTPETTQVNVSIAVSASFEDVAVNFGIGMCLSRLRPAFASGSG